MMKKIIKLYDKFKYYIITNPNYYTILMRKLGIDINKNKYGKDPNIFEYDYIWYIAYKLYKLNEEVNKDIKIFMMINIIFCNFINLVTLNIYDIWDVINNNCKYNGVYGKNEIYNSIYLGYECEWLSEDKLKSLIGEESKNIDKVECDVINICYISNLHYCKNINIDNIDDEYIRFMGNVNNLDCIRILENNFLNNNDKLICNCNFKTHIKEYDGDYKNKNIIQLVLMYYYYNFNTEIKEIRYTEITDTITISWICQDFLLNLKDKKKMKEMFIKFHNNYEILHDKYEIIKMIRDNIICNICENKEEDDEEEEKKE